MEYQTPEQFKEIYELTRLASYSRAAEKCIEYGFFLQDLKDASKALIPLEPGYSGVERMIEDAWNLGATAELAQQLRGDKAMEAGKG